ncbi:translational activator of cytochrome c oxidase 1 [Phaenicophaeus curvirostris]|uniref:translational activator of cytochrome c oxidase 1 n=1 Tax=Phaenicophaeus curvirostris TaxID=33595 RepID=UPI0037F0C5AE
MAAAGPLARRGLSVATRDLLVAHQRLLVAHRRLQVAPQDLLVASQGLLMVPQKLQVAPGGLLVAHGGFQVAHGGLLVAPGGLLVAHRGLHGCPRACAGHNRWSKVRNVKGPRDAARSHRFQRLAAMLRLAARAGGPDPALNAALAQVVEQCRASHMPKATIAAAIHGSERSEPGTRLLLEARGPGGAAIVLQVLTDNARRSHQHLRGLLARHGATLAEGARHGFEEQGVVAVAPRDARGRPLTMEAALEAALDAGAHDVVQDEDDDEEEAALKFLCSPSALRSVRERLEASGLRPLSSSIEFFPRDLVELPEETRALAQNLLQALSDHPDVLHVYHNIQ